MDWFIRFTLGLPARVEDVLALRQVLPELDNEEIKLELCHYFWFFHSDFNTNDKLLDALRKWAAMIESSEKIEEKNSLSCPLVTCPNRSSQSKISKGDEPLVLELLVAAGGPAAKSPKESFLDLVRNTHSQNDIPCEIIITDPYIYSDVSEDDIEGGFNNLISYLEALGLSSNDYFVLRMTPSPKRGTVTAKKNLHRLLENKFKNIKIENYSPKLKFHDRFYVVRHKSGKIKGVFGPSMNGLSSDAIVLMGDITGIQPLKKLEKWFGES